MAGIILPLQIVAQSLTVREIPELTLSPSPGLMQQVEWSGLDLSFWSPLMDSMAVTNEIRVMDKTVWDTARFYRTWVTGWDSSALLRSASTNEPVGVVRPRGLVWIPPGTFQLGSPPSEPGRLTNETRKAVTFARGYWMSTREVTQSEYRSLMGNNPSGFPGDDRPVENVTWFQAADYCQRLTLKASKEGQLPPGYVYRLPTDAEWEYAARSGTETIYPWGDGSADVSRHAWSFETSENSTHPVGLRSPNRWGLHDMIGNVWEWCSDWAFTQGADPVLEPSGPVTGALRVIRGGSYLDRPALLRSACRFAFRPDWTLDCLGFRTVLAPSTPFVSPKPLVRMVSEITLTGTKGAQYRIEKTRSPSDADSWKLATQIDLVSGTLAVWTDVAEAKPGWFYRAIRIDPSGGGGGPLGPGEPAIGRPPQYVWIPAGTFMMGSPTTEVGRRSNESLHQVTLTRGYWMSDHEVTESEFTAALGRPSPVSFGANHPAFSNWVDAVRYCETLTEKERIAGRLPDGFAYRLPTEAEWENACRAGSTTRYYWGDDIDWTEIGRYAWSNWVECKQVRTKLPNAWGLYDMSGNLWEWCVDGYQADFPTTPTDPVGLPTLGLRSIRGGGYRENFTRSRSAARNGLQPDDLVDMGIRPVLARPL